MWLIESDLFMIDVIDGRRAGKICLIILVGIGSKQHDFEFPFKMSSDTSDSEILLKASSLLLHTIFFVCPVGAIDILGSLFHIPDILSKKKVAILFTNSELDEEVGRAVFLCL